MIEIIQWFKPYLLKRFEEQVEEALYGHMTVQDLARMVRLGNLRAVTVVKDSEPVGFAIYSIVAYPRRNMMRVDVLVGENAKEWIGKLYEHLKETCIYYGLDGIEFCGRKGFMRFLKDIPGVVELSYAFVEVPWDSEQGLQ